MFRANANVSFVYFGDLHNASSKPHRYRESRWASTSGVDAEGAVRAIAALANVRVQNITVRTSLPHVRETPRWPTQYDAPTRLIAATTVLRMRDMVAQTLACKYTLCLREDALWYHPLRLDLVDVRDERVYFKACMNYGGVNNKVLTGPPTRVRDVLTDVHQSFWRLPDRRRPPYNLEALLKQTLLARHTPYAQPRAEFDARGEMRAFGITLADGVRTGNGTCFRGRYWGGTRTPRSHVGGCGETMHPRPRFAIC